MIIDGSPSTERHSFVDGDQRAHKRTGIEPFTAPVVTINSFNALKMELLNEVPRKAWCNVSFSFGGTGTSCGSHRCLRNLRVPRASHGLPRRLTG